MLEKRMEKLEIISVNVRGLNFVEKKNISFSDPRVYVISFYKNNICILFLKLDVNISLYQ